MRRLLAGAAALSMLVAACGNDDSDTEAAQGGPAVVVTTSIWADVVGNVACDGLATVETLIPVGGDSHSFEPSLADRGRMEAAVLVVANGLFLEEGLEDTIDAVEDSGTPVFRVGDHVGPDLAGAEEHAEDDHADEEHGDEEHGDEEHAEDEHGDEEHAEDEHGDEEHAEDDHGDEEHAEDDHGHDHDHDHAGGDPHVWFDPMLVSAALPELAEHLVEHAGLDPEAVDACVTAYQEELAEVDAEIAELVAAVPESGRNLVTNHESLGHFAERYGFDVVGTVIPAPTTLAQTSPGQLEELAEAIEESGVRAIFAEAQHSPADAEALAARVGDIEVHTLLTESLGEPGSGAETYVEFMRTNAQTITDALT